MSEEHNWTMHHSKRFHLCRKCGVSREIATNLKWDCSGDIVHAPVQMESGNRNYPMTEQQFLAMEPLEQNALVAEKVMGEPEPVYLNGTEAVNAAIAGSPLKSEKGCWTQCVRFENGDVPFWRPDPFTTDRAASLAMVDALSMEWGFAAFHYPGLSSAGFGWVVAFAKSLRPYSLEIITLGDPEKVKHGHSNDLPEAIVIAALKVVGEVT